MNTLIEQLKVIRPVPRKMHISYLKAHGLFDQINELVPENFKMREKIDIIIKNEFLRCNLRDCTNHAKADSLWCSLACMNADTSSPGRKIISEKNLANAKVRMQKTRETNLKLYGVEHVRQRADIKSQIKSTMNAVYDRFRDETFMKYDLDRNLFLDHDFLKSICKNSGLFKVAKEHFNDMPPTTIMGHFKHIGFDPGWKIGGSSHGEREIFDFVKSLFPNHEVLNNHRKLMKKELDIYVPHKNIAIEYHGLYWHSDIFLESKGVDAKKLHLSKMELASTFGIQLLQFFADEWELKRPIVKSIITSKLGIFNERIFARKCTIYSPSLAEARLFFNDNHIQGWAVGKSFALKYEGKIVAMISTAKTRFDKSGKIELIRFATILHTQVVGGFGKLLAHAKSQLQVEEIITFADLRYSSGEIYKKFGTLISQTAPAYYWVNLKKTERLNRFKTQKHRLPTLLGAKFEPSETEEQNMIRNGYTKIFDCGQLKFSI